MSVMMRVSQMTREGHDSQVGGGLPTTLAMTRVIFLGASWPVEGHRQHWPPWPSIISYPESVKFRAFRKISVPAYQNDVKGFFINESKTPDDINNLIDYYNSTLHNLTDKCAPLQCKKIKLRPHLPWYTSALHREKRARRMNE